MPELQLSHAEIILLATSKDIDKTLAGFASEKGMQVVDFSKIPSEMRVTLEDALAKHRLAMDTPDLEDDKEAKKYLEQVVNAILRYVGKKAREIAEAKTGGTAQ
jgi:hypothetical protein